MIVAEVRRWTPSDSVEDITAMLHRAYGRLADQGLHYNASHQSPRHTQDRLIGGTSFLAVIDGRIVGCISLYPGRPNAYHSYYQRDDVAYFGQFAVEPEFQGHGIGRMLYQMVENHARLLGKSYLALDTAEPALDLIAMYRRWGFEIVDEADWTSTNYRSVIMAKPLA